jgi:hypothetical protein
LILVHFKDGTTKKLDPNVEVELRALDDPTTQRQVTRVAIIHDGKRVDLPARKRKFNRVWIERVVNGDSTKGERVCMLAGKTVLQVTLFYSDGRVVIDS